MNTGAAQNGSESSESVQRPEPAGVLDLPADTVDVWTVPPMDPGEAWELLDVPERQRTALISHPGRREQYVTGHAALHRIQARYAGPSRPARISLTHTRGLILAAVAHHPVGVDVEYIDHGRMVAPLVRRCCGIEEQVSWAALPLASQTEAFYRLWCAKEALYKSIYHLPTHQSPPLAARIFPDLLCSRAVTPPDGPDPVWVPADLHDDRTICLFSPGSIHQAACAVDVSVRYIRFHKIGN